MADTSLFSRLSRLFSSDVIIRNVGGNQIKVIDSSTIQATGELQTNSLIDRYVGDALSARGITVSGAQGTYVAEYILDN